MKIEIALQDVESMRAKIKQLEKEVKDLEDKLQSLSEPALKKEAVKLSWRLFNDYLHATFTHLGFESTNQHPVNTESNLEHWLGKSWYSSARIQFELGAVITNNFKRAFLNIGIVPAENNE